MSLEWCGLWGGEAEYRRSHFWKRKTKGEEGYVYEYKSFSLGSRQVKKSTEGKFPVFVSLGSVGISPIFFLYISDTYFSAVFSNSRGGWGGVNLVNTLFLELLLPYKPQCLSVGLSKTNCPEFFECPNLKKCLLILLLKNPLPSRHLIVSFSYLISPRFFSQLEHLAEN